MPYILKQSTASQEVVLGPFLDDTDGKTAETGLTIANTDILLHKTGGTTLSAKNSGGATHISNGLYYAVLDATDTDTLGPLVIYCHVSGALPVRLECDVLAANVFDARYGTDKLQVDTVEISGDSTAADNLEAACDGGSYNVGGGAVVAASVTGAVGSVTGAVGSVTGNVGGNVAGSVASVTAGVTLADDAITAAKFDETTAFPVKYADTGATLIARVGAQMDLVNAPNATAIAAIKTAMEAAGGHLALILADTGELQTDWANGGRLDLLIDAIKAITDQINFTGTDVNANASVALTEGDIASIASGVAAAIKLTTGWTAGGTLTYAEVVKIIAAAVAGKVIDKAGVAGTVQHLDVEDKTTAIFENIPSNTTSPYRDPTIL